VDHVQFAEVDAGWRLGKPVGDFCDKPCLKRWLDKPPAEEPDKKEN
jgi:hypothetical protein